MTGDPVFLYDDPTLDFHDATCPCSRHCRNCWRILTGRERFYCSDYCGQRYRAEVEFDRIMTEGRGNA